MNSLSSVIFAQLSTLLAGIVVPLYGSPVKAQTLDPLKKTDALVAISVERSFIDHNLEAKWVPIAEGTGFIISPRGYVLTARHNFPSCTDRESCEPDRVEPLSSEVIKDTDAIRIFGKVRDRYSSSIPMIPVEGAAIGDFVLLKLPETRVLPAHTEPCEAEVSAEAEGSQQENGYAFFHIGNAAKVRDGDQLMALGFPEGYSEPIPLDGRRTGPDGPEASWQVSVAMGPGISGGPVFDANGGVVGIVFGGVPNSFPPLGYVHPINHASGLLEIAYATTVEDLQAQAQGLSEPAPPRFEPLTTTFIIDRTKADHPNLLDPHTRTYTEKFEADPNFHFEDNGEVVLMSANNSSSVRVRADSDRKRLFAEYDLTSGPAIDRWRGWLKANVIATQVPD